jgi:hypothetical protein
MASEPNTGTAGQPLSAEAAQRLADEAAQQVAASPSPAEQAAASAAAMTDRGPELPAENAMDTFMEQMRAQFDSMSAEIAALKTQQATYFAAQGTPMAVRYAEGADDKAKALVAAHPDAPRGHFAALTSATAALKSEAAKLVKGDGDGSVSVLTSAEQAIQRFATRTHVRQWGKHIDWSALLEDAETAVDEALKLAA